MLPAEIAEASSLEIYPLRDGAFIAIPAGMIEGVKYARKGALTDGEKAVVKKLAAVRFEKRTPEEVGKELSGDEKGILDGLMKKGLVVFFHKGKYEGKGVYNISDAAFREVREGAQAAVQPNLGAERQASAQLSAGARQAAQPAARIPPSSPAHLGSHGWMVLEGEADARNFAGSFAERIRLGEIRGMRAFDGRYYLITRAFAEKWETPVITALSKSAKGAEEIGKEIGMAPEGCRAILTHLCESGEAMERQRGKFVRA